ncbi:hypothetical protein [Nocardioides pacificus]
MNYDYGGMRETWLTHAVTDWMGDDAWLWKLSCQHRKFNYMGDTTDEVLLGDAGRHQDRVAGLLA